MPRMQEFIVIDPHPVLIICSHTCVNVSLLWFQLLSQFIDATKSMFSYKGISSLSYSFITLGWRGRPQFLVNICCRLYLIARKMALQAMTQAHMDTEHVLESKWRTNFLRPLCYQLSQETSGSTLANYSPAPIPKQELHIADEAYATSLPISKYLQRCT